MVAKLVISTEGLIVNYSANEDNNNYAAYCTQAYVSTYRCVAIIGAIKGSLQGFT